MRSFSEMTDHDAMCCLRRILAYRGVVHDLLLLDSCTSKEAVEVTTAERNALLRVRAALHDKLACLLREAVREDVEIGADRDSAPLREWDTLDGAVRIVRVLWWLDCLWETAGRCFLQFVPDNLPQRFLATVGSATHAAGLMLGLPGDLGVTP